MCNNYYKTLLAKHTLDVWVNGQIAEVTREFVEGGTEMKFNLDQAEAVIRSESSQGSKEITYSLFVDNRLILDDSK